MSLTVEQLQASAASAASLDAAVRDHLSMIDTKLREGDRMFGRNIVEISLNINFNIPGLELADQQRYIYSNIINSLRSRNFEVSIILEEDATTLFIAFDVGFDQASLDAMNKTIRQIKIHPEEVKLFMEEGLEKVKEARAAKKQ